MKAGVNSLQTIYAPPQSKHEGIILRYHERYGTYTIFDAHKGKITCSLKRLPRHGTYSPGLLIAYNIIDEKKLILDDVEPLFAPCLQADELVFVHFIIECCFFFAQEEQADLQLFLLLKKILTLSANPLSLQHQKILAYVFFNYLGIESEQSAHNAFLQTLMHIPIDSILSLEISLEDELVLSTLIRENLQLHPLLHTFKTIRFFSL